MVNIKSLTVAATALFGLVAAAPAVKPAPKSGDIIPNSYIVTLKNGNEARSLDTHLEWVNELHNNGKRALAGVQRTYDGATKFKGYAGLFDKETIEQIRSHPEVSSYHDCY